MFTDSTAVFDDAAAVFDDAAPKEVGPGTPGVGELSLTTEFEGYGSRRRFRKGLMASGVSRCRGIGVAGGRLGGVTMSAGAFEVRAGGGVTESAASGGPSAGAASGARPRRNGRKATLRIASSNTFMRAFESGPADMADAKLRLPKSQLPKLLTA